MLDGGTNCGKGEQLWQPYMIWGTIGCTVLGLARPLVAWTTYGVIGTVWSCVAIPLFPLLFVVVKKRKNTVWTCEATYKGSHGGRLAQCVS